MRSGRLLSRFVIAVVLLTTGCLHIRLAVDSPEQRCKDLFEGAEWIPPSCEFVLRGSNLWDGTESYRW